MSARRAGIGLLLALAVAGAAPPAKRPATGAATATLVRRLGEGRGEVSLVQREADALGGAGPARRGTLAIEPPDRLRLALADGEVLTVRRDGGEWLQPALGQMIRFGPEGAGAATHLWNVLLGRASGTIESPRGPGRWHLRFASGEAALDSVVLDLGRDGLPARLVAWPAAGGRFEARFSGWKFGPARGAAGFSQEAPPGVELVPLGP